jgi:hypothetical protein
VRRVALRAAVLAMIACNRDSLLAPPEASYKLSAAGGDMQRAPAGSVLPVPLAVLVADAAGSPVKDANVVFRVVRGAATGSRVLDSIGVTSASGVATTLLQLGSALDTTIVSAFPAPAIRTTVMLSAVATAAPALKSVTPGTFGAGDTVTLRGTGLGVVAAGGVVAFGDARVTPLAGATDGAVRVLAPACLAPGAVDVRLVAGLVQSNAVSGTYLSRTASVTLAPFQALTITSARLADCLTLDGNGASYLVVAEYAGEGPPTQLIDWKLGANASSGSLAGAATALRLRGDNPVQREFEALLRRNERAIAPQARAEVAAGRHEAINLQLVSAAPPALGSLRAFHVIAALDGSSYTDITARLAYSGDHLLLYVDTVGTGFSDQQYHGLGTLFDQNLYSIAVSAFGSESDVDRNGRILAVFTPVVNRLIASQTCSLNGYVTGFFNSDDLLVQNANSNRAEVFYSFIPDSTGVFSCPHTATDVLRILPGTFIHELQHMISFNQHVLSRMGEGEETWLNEGLSQIAEELASKYYEAKFPPPTGRSTTTQLFPDSSGPFIAPQLLNAYAYMNSTRVHSVTSYNGTGSLEERGATWLFLRWLAEQKGEALFGRLVQTSKTGIANVEDKAGEPFGALFGDFSLALYADSVPGQPRSAVPPRYTFGSRDLHALMAREAVISGFQDAFPLPVFSLRVGGFLQSQMLPGTMTHTALQAAGGSGPVALRFTHQDLSAFASGVGAQVSIFRLPP